MIGMGYHAQLRANVTTATDDLEQENRQARGMSTF